MSQKLPQMLESTITKIREMVDSNSVVGDPISVADGVTIIPVSKISIGLGGGGSDFTAKNATSDAFGGGEDYRLLLTVDRRKVDELSQRFESEFGKPLYKIGRIVKPSSSIYQIGLQDENGGIVYSSAVNSSRCSRFKTANVET